MFNSLRHIALIALVGISTAAVGDPPATLSDNLRYLSMGDSNAAGKGAIPVTRGYAYLLYQQGFFASIPNTTFANSAVPGTWSKDVLEHQVPQAISAFRPHVITMSVGGNDLGRWFTGTPLSVVLADYQANMHAILCGLRDGLAAKGIMATIVVSNQYDYPFLGEIYGPIIRQGVIAINQVLAQEAAACGAKVADVFTAFDGRQELYLNYRNGASATEPHPTNAGYEVMAKAFKEAAAQ
jgi:lysophospholipase L1-like esterase